MFKSTLLVVLLCGTILAATIPVKKNAQSKAHSHSHSVAKKSSKLVAAPLKHSVHHKVSHKAQSAKLTHGHESHHEHHIETEVVQIGSAHGHHAHAHEEKVELDLVGLAPTDEVIVHHHEKGHHGVETEVIHVGDEVAVPHHAHHAPAPIAPEAEVIVVDPEQDVEVVNVGHHQPEDKVEVDITGLAPTDEIIVHHHDEAHNRDETEVIKVEQDLANPEAKVEVDLVGLAPEDEIIIEHHDDQGKVEIEKIEIPVNAQEEVIVVNAEAAGEKAQAAAAATGPAHGSFFNTHFGKTNQGSIALANSYSTGQKGSATSHATSHGNKAH